MSNFFPSWGKDDSEEKARIANRVEDRNDKIFWRNTIILTLSFIVFAYGFIFDCDCNNNMIKMAKLIFDVITNLAIIRS